MDNETDKLAEENILLRKILMMVELMVFDKMDTGTTDQQRVTQIQELIKFYKTRRPREE
jgi:hypothetical protein